MFDWFPRNVSTYGGDIDHVFYLILYVVGFWFVLSEALIIYFIIRYRRREGRKASFISGENWAQLAWILVPAAIVLVLDLGIDFVGARAYEKVKGEIPEGDVLVQVTGKQFNWEFTYPGPDGELGTADDLTLDNELNVPVGKVVRILLLSEDVIHSFFVPVLRLKQDILPGRVIPAWFEVTEPGTYEIACAELCGFGHYTMRGLLIAHTPGEYERWVEENWPAEREG
jgi:cytochrome c oxidase subunit 2